MVVGGIVVSSRHTPVRGWAAQQRARYCLLAETPGLQGPARHHGQLDRECRP